MLLKYKPLAQVAKYCNSRIYSDNINYINYISTENMLPDKGGVARATSVPSQAVFSRYDAGDILLSNIRPYFKKIWYATATGGCSNDVLIVRADGVDSKFLYYALSDNNFFNYSSITSKGTKMPRGSKTAIMKYLIPDYDRRTQHRIASILSAYDDAIENNNRRVALLERAAREIYREWFVRLRFPGHENTKIVNGLPEGWGIEPVKYLAEIKSGYAFKSEWWRESGIPVIKIKDIQNNTLDLNNFDYVEPEHASKANKFYVDAGDLLIAMTGATIGKIALVPSNGKILVNQRVGKFFLGENPLEKVGFLYCFFQQDHIQEQIIQLSGSNSAQPNISPYDLCNIKMTYNQYMIEKYNKKVSSLFSQVINLRSQSQNLARQRDMLLPRLMSGKMGV